MTNWLRKALDDHALQVTRFPQSGDPLRQGDNDNQRTMHLGTYGQAGYASGVASSPTRRIRYSILTDRTEDDPAARSTLLRLVGNCATTNTSDQTSPASLDIVWSLHTSASGVTSRRRVVNRSVGGRTSAVVLSANVGMSSADEGTYLWFETQNYGVTFDLSEMAISPTPSGAEAPYVASIVHTEAGVPAGTSGADLACDVHSPMADIATLVPSEGTWTPSLAATGATFVYSSQSGTWRRTGRLCFFTADIELDPDDPGFDAGTGAYTMTLPFDSSVAARSGLLWFDFRKGGAFCVGVAKIQTSTVALQTLYPNSVDPGSNDPMRRVGLTASTGSAWVTGNYIRMAGVYEVDTGE